MPGPIQDRLEQLRYLLQNKINPQMFNSPAPGMFSNFGIETPITPFESEPYNKIFNQWIKDQSALKAAYLTNQPVSDILNNLNSSTGNSQEGLSKLFPLEPPIPPNPINNDFIRGIEPGPQELHTPRSNVAPPIETTIPKVNPVGFEGTVDPNNPWLKSLQNNLNEFSAPKPSPPLEVPHVSVPPEIPIPSPAIAGAVAAARGLGGIGGAFRKGTGLLGAAAMPLFGLSMIIDLLSKTGGGSPSGTPPPDLGGGDKNKDQTPVGPLINTGIKPIDFVGNTLLSPFQTLGNEMSLAKVPTKEQNVAEINDLVSRNLISPEIGQQMLQNLSNRDNVRLQQQIGHPNLQGEIQDRINSLQQLKAVAQRANGIGWTPQLEGELQGLRTKFGGSINNITSSPQFTSQWSLDPTGVNSLPPSHIQDLYTAWRNENPPDTSNEAFAKHLQGIGAGPDQSQGGGEYTVQPGDNLWDISQRLLGGGQNWNNLYQLNKEHVIGNNPNLIHPGQKLKLPGRPSGGLNPSSQNTNTTTNTNNSGNAPTGAYSTPQGSPAQPSGVFNPPGSQLPKPPLNPNLSQEGKIIAGLFTSLSTPLDVKDTKSLVVKGKVIATPMPTRDGITSAIMYGRTIDFPSSDPKNSIEVNFNNLSADDKIQAVQLVLRAFSNSPSK